ncbi:MAG: sodium/solute symporter [Acidobacteriota bacterium]
MSGALDTVDLIVIAAYLVGVVGLGLWQGRKVKTAADFFLAGKTLPFWAVGMSIVVSDIGATDFIAVAGGTYRYGLAQANFDWLGSMPALLICAFLFVPFYWRSGVLTIPEFLGRRYGGAVRTFLAVCWGFILLFNLGIMIHATAVLLRGVLGWEPALSIWVTAVVVGLYTISGGLTAVVMTDVLQLVIMFLGGGVLVFTALQRVGGWSAMKEAILAQGPAYSDHFSLYLPHDSPTPFPWSGVVLGLGIVLSTAYYSGNQSVAQRALGARSEWDAKAGVLLAGGLKLFIPLLVALPGLAAILLVPGLENGDDAVPSLIGILLPAGLRGLMFAAFLAALMSSVDSNLNSATTLWTHDIVGRLLAACKRPIPERFVLRVGRTTSFLLLVFGALLAPEIEERFTNIYNAIQSVFSLIQGPTLAILLLGLLWPRANRHGALAGLLVGVGFCVLLNTEAMAGLFPSEEPFLFIAWWSFVLSLTVTAIVSWLTPPEPAEKLLGLTWGSVAGDPRAQAALEARARRAEEDEE